MGRKKTILSTKLKTSKPIKSVENRRKNGTFGPGNIANPNGRPKGKSFKDYFEDKEIEDVVKWAKKNYKKNPKIFQIVVEHLFGKPKQPIEGTGEEGEFIFRWQK